MITTDGIDCGARVELLFYSYTGSDSQSQTTWHRHSHWQVEIVRKGPFWVNTDSLSGELDTDDMLIIPPYQRHRFQYPAQKVEWVTIRFDYSPASTGTITDEIPQIVGPGPMTEAFRTLTIGLLPESNRIAVEHVLAGLLAQVYVQHDSEHHDEPSSFVRKVRHVIKCRASGRLTVPEVAREIGYSTSHATAECKRLTGHSLKHEIDRARADISRQLLLYSDHNISEIAEQLDFSDVYAFSRFIKRMFGRSPRTLRQKNNI